MKEFSFEKAKVSHKAKIAGVRKRIAKVEDKITNTKKVLDKLYAKCGELNELSASYHIGLDRLYYEQKKHLKERSLK